MNLINHFIGGKLTPGTSEIKGKVYDPSIGEQKSEVFLGNKSDIDEAIKVYRDLKVDSLISCKKLKKDISNWKFNLTSKKKLLSYLV